MVGELIITLWDFVEEDRTRRLPATERVTHTLLTLNYGIVLAMLAPLLTRWAALPTGITATYHGLRSWLCGIAAIGVPCQVYAISPLPGGQFESCRAIQRGSLKP
jgi:uncharacterized protein